MAQERDLVLEREKTQELTQKLEAEVATLQATADLSTLTTEESADMLSALRAEVTKAKGAFAKADGQRMALERELEAAREDQEEMAKLRSEVAKLRTEYAQTQGFQMALERDLLEKTE